MDFQAEHVDVIVIGAGISGISAGYHLSRLCPDRSFAILEGRPDLGGTWDLFRYPGVRSDSDMHTLGFSFKPWVHQKSIADGPSIMAYLRETVEQFGLAPRIRYRHRVLTAEWSSEHARWTLSVQRGDEPEPITMTCGFIMMCAGYYSYRHGHEPHFEGRDQFQGRVVHPQAWPQDLDWNGQRVVVIGSGATAMTIVPAMARTAAHVTMLQRSPTYVVARPDEDRVANALRRVLPARWAYAVTRVKNTTMQQLVYRRSRTHPQQLRRRLLDGVRASVGPEVDVERHFTPTYDPWDQRLCLLPHGDLFTALRTGQVSVVTDHIDRFTTTGIRLVSGDELPADIIVTATGLEVVTMGEVALSVDGTPVDLSTTWTYKGVAYSDVPNLLSVFGYINASWTLRADLINDYACRVLNHMWATGTQQVTPRLRPADANMQPRPWITEFSAGYLQRVMGDLPRQGDREPWVNPQRLAADRRLIARAPIDDGVLQFTRATSPAPSPT
jgi:cation diffusion facilitator CzcD-associated flavoprotein CzcO